VTFVGTFSEGYFEMTTPDPPTSQEIEELAHGMDQNERLRIWLEACPTPHDWKALPMVTGGNEHFCPNCLTVFSSTGGAFNAPSRPSAPRP
jgi:hypothetical protein